jgi:hypothetical protein
MGAMRLFISVMPRFMAFVACLLLSAHAWSQYGSDRGQWQILEARYGTAERNVDVTQTLRNLARQDSSFRVTNKTFGNDPDPGVVKTLRIYARGPGGGTRTFEYIENDVVDGNVFTGWTSGNWGQGGGGGGWGSPGYEQPVDRGEWQILEARYGTAARNIDVTQRLRELARQDNSFEVNNKLFGNDPDPGVVKTLRIYARGPGGATRTFEYGEEQVVMGTMFTGWSSGNWGQGGWNSGWGHDSGSGVPHGGVTIVSAQYGEGPDRVDVTSRLRSMVRDGRISIRVDNRTMGSDPASGRPKILWVTYYAGGQGQRQVKVYENADLTLP